MSQKIIVIDNYDSFVYNLVHYLEELDCIVKVVRNDQFHIDDLSVYDKILLSPGPGIPDEAGVFGGSLINLDEVFHGVATTIDIVKEDTVLFNTMDTQIDVGRYHSWVVAKDDFPASLEITATDKNGQIMALRHREYDVRGVQFHPESVLTPQGKTMIKNWINS